MNLLEPALDSGFAVQLLLLPAILGTVVLGTIRVVARNPRNGVFQGSLSIVLGAAAATVALNLTLALDVLVRQGASAAMVVGTMRVVGGTFLLALAGVSALTVLEFAATLRHRNAPEATAARGLRPVVVAAWTAAAVAITSVVAFLLRIAASLDPSTLAPLDMANPTRELATLTMLGRFGVAGGFLAIVGGLAALWLAFGGFRSPAKAEAAIGDGGSDAEGVHG